MQACVCACVRAYCVWICACRDRNEEAVGRSEWEDERGNVDGREE